MSTNVNTATATSNLSQNHDPVASKWINTFLFVASVIVGYLFNTFLVKIGVWFELESKISYFKYLQLILSLVVVVSTLIYVRSRTDLMTFLFETFYELTKVVFPDKNQSFRLSIFVIIWVTIIGFVLTVFDWAARLLITMISKI